MPVPRSSLLLALVVASAAAPAQTTPLRYRDAMFSVSVTRDVVYGRNWNPWKLVTEDLLLDVYEPTPDAASLRPALIYVHGGQHYYGSKGDGPVTQNCSHFTWRGYVCFAIDYRLALVSNPIGMPDALSEDIKAAVRFIRKNAAVYRVDAERIVCGGDSVGADGSIFASQSTVEGNSGNPGYRSDLQCVLDLWGWKYATIVNPTCGLVIVHGTLDPAVPFTHALALKAEAQACGAPCAFIPLEGAGHSPWDRWLTFAPLMTEAIYETLRLQELDGLEPVPPWQSPGLLQLRIAGWETQGCTLFAGNPGPPIRIPGIGALALDPLTLVAVTTATFGAGTGLTTQILSIPVPSGISGDFGWQVLVIGGAPNVQAARLSNPVVTRF